MDFQSEHFGGEKRKFWNLRPSKEEHAKGGAPATKGSKQGSGRHWDCQLSTGDEKGKTETNCQCLHSAWQEALGLEEVTLRYNISSTGLHPKHTNLRVGATGRMGLLSTNPG